MAFVPSRILLCRRASAQRGLETRFNWTPGHCFGLYRKTKLASVFVGILVAIVADKLQLSNSGSPAFSCITHPRLVTIRHAV